MPLRPRLEFPNGNHHCEYLAHKKLGRFALLPPSLRIEIAIASAGHAYLYGLWKNVAEDVSRAPGVIIGSNDDGAMPFFWFGELDQGFGLLSGAVAVLWKTQDLVFGHTALDQIVFH